MYITVKEIQIKDLHKKCLMLLSLSMSKINNAQIINF